METNVETLARDLENIYENKCLKIAEGVANKKCLSLDEQELAIIHMCVEGLVDHNGINNENYISKGLFILLKNRDLDESACRHNKIKNQPLKFKRILSEKGFDIKDMSDNLLVYYSILLLLANENSTGDNYLGETNRNYFRIYAYFACICPKTFSILFFNQIYIFISKAHKTSSNSELNEYLKYTKELWSGYNFLLQNENRINVLEQAIPCFRKFMSYDRSVLYDSMIRIYNLIEKGFLGFDFKSCDTIRGYRFKTILVGIEYFQWYLKYLREKVSECSFVDEESLRMIEDIFRETEVLKIIFNTFLDKEKSRLSQFERKFDNISGLLNDFCNYCKDNNIILMKI